MGKFEIEGEECIRSVVKKNGVIMGFTKWIGREVAVVILAKKME